MPLTMPHYNAFAPHAPAVPSCQAGPHLVAPKTHQPQLHMSPDSPERGRKDRPVILSAAKDLVAHRARPFAAPRVAIGGSRQTLRDAQGDTVRSLSLMRIGPHFAGPCSNRKLISSTFIAYHFDKDLIRIFILIPLQCRAQEQQIFFHELKQLPETHIRANYTRLQQKMGRKTVAVDQEDSEQQQKYQYPVCLALQ